MRKQHSERLKIRCIILLILLFSGIKYSRAQNISFSVITNTPMLFPLNTGAKLESSQTVGGALTLQVKNRSGGARSVYVRISNVSAPSGFNYNSLTASEGLQLDYTSDNSSNESNLITTALKITTTDQKLFTHAQHSSNSTYSFNYDAILLATNWKWYPGTYTITLLFTFVAP